MVRLLLLPLGLAAVAADQCEVQPVDKVDCHIGAEPDCEAAGCCWRPVSPNPSNLPWCYHKAGTVKSCTLKGSPRSPFSETEIAEIQSLFEANLDIQGSGMVVAAPDHNTGAGGDYYYAWMRDGALSMNAYLQVAGTAATSKMDDWLAWVERSYNQPDPNGDIMTEPKFNIPSGTPYAGGWCRPQTDGPGLRAITLMAYASVNPSVKQRAWAMVRKELDWVAANYSSSSCDLWEEVRSNDFFWNRYTMRKALLQGSAFAESVGQDTQRASAYAAAAKAVTQGLSSHVGADGFVSEAANRMVDSAVVEAFNVGDMSDGVFAPLSREAAQTLMTLSHYFCNAFAINQQGASANIPGVLFGRYQGDSYDGGNPWILLTASAATLLYRQSLALAKGGTLGPEAEEALGSLLGETGAADDLIVLAECAEQSCQEVNPENLLAGGDAMLLRVKSFLTNGMHMNEQLDRNSGRPLSAKDLTWNYANVLKAMLARKAADTAGAVKGSLHVITSE